MAEARVTQAGVLVEVSGSGVGVTQAGLLVEISPDGIRTTQAGLLVEVSQDGVCVTLAGLLIELEYVPPPPVTGWAGQNGQTRAQGQRARRDAAPRRALSQGAQVRAALRQAAVAGSPAPAMAGMTEQRLITGRIYVDWNRDGVWTDESANLVSAQGQQRLTAPEQAITGGGGMTDQVSVTLANADGRYSSRFAGALIDDLQGGGAFQAPVRVEVSVGAETSRLFTGVVRGVTETGKGAQAPAQVVLDCRSRDDLLLGQRLSTDIVTWRVIRGGGHAEDWYICQFLTAAGMVDGVDFVSQAYAAAHPPMRPTVDPGLFSVPFLWLNDESPLEKIWGLAAACGGWFYADVDGVLRYHNMAGFTAGQLARQFGSQSPVSLTEDNTSGVTLAYSDRDLCDEVTVETSPLTGGEYGAIADLQAPVVVQPGATVTTWAEMENAGYFFDKLKGDAIFASGVSANAYVTGGMEAYAQRVKLWWTNTHPSEAIYVRGVKLLGRPLLKGQDEKITRTVAGDDPFWRAAGSARRQGKARRVRSNACIQTEAHAGGLADFLLARGKRPVAVCRISGTDRPDLRVGRKVQATFQGLIDGGHTLTGVVTGLTWTLNSNGFKQDAEVLDVGGLLDGLEPFFVLGTHSLGSSGANIARLFW